MIVHLDTCVLVDALTGPRRLLSRLERTIAAGHVIATSTLVLYEWVRGPRTQDELEDQEALLPAKNAVHSAPRKPRPRRNSIARGAVPGVATCTSPLPPVGSSAARECGRST